MPIVLRSLHIKYELNTALEKVVIKVLLWFVWHFSSQSMTYEADAYCPKEMFHTKYERNTI